MEYKTKCKECVFASNKGRCDLDRLEKFQKHGASLNKDEDGNIIINSRFCSAYRTEIWTKNKDRYNLPTIVRAELLISNEVYIYISNDNYTEESIIKTLCSLSSQLLKPNLVVLIVNRDNVNYQSLIKILKQSNIKYRLDRIMTEDDGARIHELDAIDITAKKMASDYYLVMYPGGTLEDGDFFANIDEALNEKLERFTVLLPNEKGDRGMFVSAAIHKKLNGNTPMSSLFIDEKNGSKEEVFNSLKEKIDYLATKDNHKSFIKTYKEIRDGN